MRNDPLLMSRTFWPQEEEDPNRVVFYDKQIEVMESVRDNDETDVVAGNMLGKDFIAAYIMLWYFLTHIPCRIVATSVTEDHLDVLWAELLRFVERCRAPLRRSDGGVLIMKHLDIRRTVDGKEDRISWIKGVVVKKGKEEGSQRLSGHHAKHTLAVIDEAAGVDDVSYNRMSEWAKKFLIFGNPHQCNNFFRRNVAAGDLPKRSFAGVV